MILDDIRDAIARADSEAFDALLNAEDSDLNAFSLDALLGMCVLAAAQSQSRNESRHQLEIGRLLVARGARADGPLGNERLLQSPLVMPITSLNDSDEIVAWYDLLIGAGADPNSISEVLVDGFRCRMSMLSRVLFFFPVTALITTEKRLALIKLLVGIIYLCHLLGCVWFYLHLSVFQPKHPHIPPDSTDEFIEQYNLEVEQRREEVVSPGGCRMAHERRQADELALDAREEAAWRTPPCCRCRPPAG